MIVRDRYDFPSPLWFCLLMMGSCVLPFVFDFSFRLQAGVFLMWAVFGLMRGLWILETMFLLRDTDKQQKSMILPWVILEHMDLQARLDKGFRAMRAADPLMGVWLFLVCIYALWTVYTAFTPMLPDAALLAAAKVSNFFLSYQGQAFDVVYDSGGGHCFVHLCGVVITSLSFWLARSYAFSMNEDSAFCLVFTFVLFAGCFSAALLSGEFADGPLYLPGSWRGYGFGVTSHLIVMGDMEMLRYSAFFLRSAETGISGLVFLFLPAAFFFCVLLRICFVASPRRYYALAGVMVLAALLWVDMALEARPALFSVQVSGWALLAVLWQKAGSERKRAFSIRQL